MASRNSLSSALLTFLAGIVATLAIYFAQNPAAYTRFQHLSANLLTDLQLKFHLLSVPQPTAQAHDPIHNVTYTGTVSATDVDHFQNIFYAHDTSGANRFRAPRPLHPARNSIVDATRPGAWCAQGTGAVLPFSSVITNVSEDCLSLRIARPHGTPADAQLPVMVFLFSGGHALGSAYEQLYDADSLVAQSAAAAQPVVYVAMNYRLGIFGFAATDALAAARDTNLGLRDQRAALDWIQRHIRHFGGDPSRVTAFGHSVGALDIGLHMLAHEGKGVPFHRAVMLSGAPSTAFNIATGHVKNTTLEVARELECASPNGDGQSEATVSCLQKVPMERLMNVSVSAARAARPVFGEMYRSVTLDGDMFAQRPSELLRAGKVAQGIPVMLSWDTNDGAWYPSPTTSSDDDAINSFKLWLFNLSKATTDKLLELYPLSAFESMVRPGEGVSAQYYRAAQMSRDLWFACPALDFAWQYAKRGGVGTDDVYLYEGNMTRFAPVWEAMGVPFWRAAHLSSIPYVFNTQTLSAGADNSPEQRALAQTLSSSIVGFANGERPRTGKSWLKQWPSAFGDASREDLGRDHPREVKVQVFGGPQRSRAVSIGGDSLDEAAIYNEKLLERCAFINSDKVRAEIGS